jgi:cysteine-rich repeat protein
VHDVKGYYVLNERIKVTGTHPIWIDGEWKIVKELVIGDKFMTDEGSEATLESIEYVEEDVTVYNLYVEGSFTYFAEGVLVHNKVPQCEGCHCYTSSPGCIANGCNWKSENIGIRQGSCTESFGPEIFCGDGYIDEGEECDDGNLESGDGCSESCEIEEASIVCGNGIRESGEGCDDGNLISGDGCSSRCTVEKTCSSCGEGLFNICDEVECGSGCEFEKKFIGGSCESTSGGKETSVGDRTVDREALG